MADSLSFPKTADLMRSEIMFFLGRFNLGPTPAMLSAIIWGFTCGKWRLRTSVYKKITTKDSGLIAISTSNVLESISTESMFVAINTSKSVSGVCAMRLPPSTSSHISVTLDFSKMGLSCTTYSFFYDRYQVEKWPQSKLLRSSPVKAYKNINLGSKTL